MLFCFYVMGLSAMQQQMAPVHVRESNTRFANATKQNTKEKAELSSTRWFFHSISFSAQQQRHVEVNDEVLAGIRCLVTETECMSHQF